MDHDLKCDPGIRDMEKLLSQDEVARRGDRQEFGQSLEDTEYDSVEV